MAPATASPPVLRCAVGCAFELTYSSGVTLFEFGTGAVVRRLGYWCNAVQFAQDGSHLIIADGPGMDPGDPLLVHDVALSTEEVKCVGEGVLCRGGTGDVVQSVSGEYVVADFDNHRVCVFSPDGSEVVRSWGLVGTGDGQLQSPTALAAAGKHLYVIDASSSRVQVFE